MAGRLRLPGYRQPDQGGHRGDDQGDRRAKTIRPRLVSRIGADAEVALADRIGADDLALAAGDAPPPDWRPSYSALPRLAP